MSCRGKRQHATLITEQWNNLERFERVAAWKGGEIQEGQEHRQGCDLENSKPDKRRPERGVSDWQERTYI